MLFPDFSKTCCVVILIMRIIFCYNNKKNVLQNKIKD